MGDALLTLSVPALLCASGLYAAFACRWSRRRPAPPSPYTRRALLLAERDALARAEGIVEDAHATLGPLYDLPGRPPPARTAPHGASGGPADRRQPDPAPGAAPRT
ncbi:hypothetical protein [uncultured Streptomyces sp.]|uniref:hypothetical protein n=1 Tax=uncultured Streptomyces sp. TaxID=174707 RepID=UPI00260A7F75|nr:hypothetical protein [uncultured Streptomyces sp.]